MSILSWVTFSWRATASLIFESIEYKILLLEEFSFCAEVSFHNFFNFLLVVFSDSVIWVLSAFMLVSMNNLVFIVVLNGQDGRRNSIFRFFKNGGGGGGSGGVVHLRLNVIGELGSLDGMAVDLVCVVIFSSNSSVVLDAAP